jgi:hypothetical protein
VKIPNFADFHIRADALNAGCFVEILTAPSTTIGSARSTL